MKGVIFWTLWQRRWSIVWWAAGLTAFIFINMVFYPSFRDQSAEFEKTFAQIPDTAKALLSDTGDFLSPVGYLSSQIFYLMMPMLLGILAISAGASLIGREEKEGTIELLLARPLSRTKLLAAKATTGAAIVIAIGIVGTMVTTVMAKAVDLAVPFGAVMLAGLAATALALSFGAVAFMISVLGSLGRAASIGVSTVVALGGYILVSLAGTVSWLAWPAKAFPFYYYHPGEILEGTYHWSNMLFILVLAVVCGVVSWLAFRRRDIGV